MSLLTNLHGVAACGNRGPLPVAGLCFFLLLSTRLWAGSWTNAAGYAVEADAVAFDGARVTLKKPSGQTMELPLHSLAPNEQKRVRILFDEEELPANLRPAYRLAETQLANARALRDDGEIDAGEFNTRKQAVVDEFLRECAAQSFPQDGDDVQRWLAKLDR